MSWYVMCFCSKFHNWDETRTCAKQRPVWLVDGGCCTSHNRNRVSPHTTYGSLQKTCKQPEMYWIVFSCNLHNFRWLSLYPPWCLNINSLWSDCAMWWYRSWSTLAQQSWKGVYWFHLACLSICEWNHVRSVSSTIQQYLLDSFHIYTSYQATSEGVSLGIVLQNSKIWIFGKFLKSVSLIGGGYSQNAGILVALILSSNFRRCVAWNCFAKF